MRNTKNQRADGVFIDKLLDDIYPTTAYIADLEEIFKTYNYYKEFTESS